MSMARIRVVMVSPATDSLGSVSAVSRIENAAEVAPEYAWIFLGQAPAMRSPLPSSPRSTSRMYRPILSTV